MEPVLRCSSCNIEYFNCKTRALDRKKRITGSPALRYDVRAHHVAINYKEGSELKSLQFSLDDTVIIHKASAAEGRMALQHRSARMTLLVVGAAPAAIEQFCHCIENKCLQRKPETGLRGSSCIESVPLRYAPEMVTSRSTECSTSLLRLATAPADMTAEPGVELTAEQKRIVTLAGAGKSLFFTGSAGCGKSFVLSLLKRVLPATTTAYTASTGIAAVPLGGVTLHAWAGLTVDMLKEFREGRLDVAGVAAALCCKREASHRWLTTRALVLDEVSMVDAATFDLLEGVARLIRRCGLPFGGIQLLACGDFFQLRPVDRGARGDEPLKFAFQAASWEPTLPTTVVLSQVFRQKGDNQFIKMLNEIRHGRCVSLSTCIAHWHFICELRVETWVSVPVDAVSETAVV